MFITKVFKILSVSKGEGKRTALGYDYYRLSEAYRDADGKPRKRVVMGLGKLDGLSKNERNELGELLTAMIERGEIAFASSEKLNNLALDFYSKYQEKCRLDIEQTETSERLKNELRLKKERDEREMVKVKLSSHRQTMARTVGPERVCLNTIERLGIRRFLTRNGFSSKQADIAIMQIVARAIYPGSELSTARRLIENSALPELLNINTEDINKDMLYRSAHKLWDVHREMEDFLHASVCDLFNIEEKIYLFDLTNTYFEGRMDASEICAYGRSKEKRDDCKIVVLAAVVNTDGLLVRTEIFEGNRQDVSTLEEIIGSLDKNIDNKKKIIVMDAGFSSANNLKWLRDNNYDYITVMRSNGKEYEAASDIIERVTDNKQQEIRLQRVTVKGETDSVLLVDSDAKTLKENSMSRKAAIRYEEGLKAIKKGIEGRGTKKRDALQRRIGRLNGKFANASKYYTVTFEYDENECATSMQYVRNEDYVEERRKMHGKYFLQTTLTEDCDKNIWTFYNVIRTVEETFKTLKTDLDIRPVFHKTDSATKSHLNLAVLAYWVVSVTKYDLKLNGINLRWGELVEIMKTQVRVTSEMETEGNKRLAIRQNTVSEKKMTAIYDALEMKYNMPIKLKSVGHPDETLEKIDIWDSGG